MKNKFTKIVMIGFQEGDLNEPSLISVAQLADQVIRLGKDATNIKHELSNADCLLLRLGGAASQDLIDCAPQLRYIGMLGTGYGRIDVAHAALRGITVCNIAGYSTNGVAEFFFAIILEHYRELCRARAQASTGDYSEATFTGTEIANKTIGVIGMGNIGRRVTEIAARGFSTPVIYWSRTRHPDIEQVNVRYDSLDSVLSATNIVTLHLPHVQGNPPLLGKRELGLMKDGSVLVNLSPMELIDLDALFLQLSTGRISAIIDHSDELDVKDAHKFAILPNCILYPPIGYTTHEATEGKQRMFVENMANFLAGTPTNKVN